MLASLRLWVLWPNSRYRRHRLAGRAIGHRKDKGRCRVSAVSHTPLSRSRVGGHAASPGQQAFRHDVRGAALQVGQRSYPRTITCAVARRSVAQASGQPSGDSIALLCQSLGSPSPCDSRPAPRAPRCRRLTPPLVGDARDRTAERSLQRLTQPPVRAANSRGTPDTHTHTHSERHTELRSSSAAQRMCEFVELVAHARLAAEQLRIRCGRCAIWAMPCIGDTNASPDVWQEVARPHRLRKAP